MNPTPGTTPLIKWGWLRALIYFIVLVGATYLVQIAASFIIQQVGDNVEDILQFSISYGLMSVVAIILIFLFRKFIDRTNIKSLGFDLSNHKNEAGLGGFLAVAILGLGILVLIAVGYVTLDIGAIDPAIFLLQTALMILVAFVEELIFRGYVLNNLMQSMNKWVALIVASLLFAIFHISSPDVAVLPIVNIFLAGLLLGINYIFTKNLWFGILLHFAWNYIQGPVLGYNVSGLKLDTLLQQTQTGSELWTGAAFGFEGSLLCSMLLLIALLAFSQLFKSRYES